MILKAAGQAMINALIASGVVAVITASIFQQATEQNRDLRLPRVKMGQLLAEAKLRTFLMSPSSFVNCGTVGGNCQLNTTMLTQTQFNGFAVQNMQFDASTGLFTAELRYTGQDMNLRPQQVRIQVPSEVLMAAQFVCPDDRPVFRRFSSSGEPQCDPLPLSTMICRPGEYLYAINPMTLAVQCRPFQTNFSCSGANQTIGRINWIEGNLVPECQSRASVFEFHQFDPSQVIAIPGSASGVTTGNPPPDPEPSPNPSYRYDNCTCERPGVWTPDESTVPCGTPFTQTNDCGSRPWTGTQACACVANWVQAADPATICTTANVPYNDTNNCPAPANPPMPNVFGTMVCGPPCVADGQPSTGANAGICTIQTAVEVDPSCCNNVGHCPGAGQPHVCGNVMGIPPCVDTAWTPDAANTVECGSPVEEVSNCGNRRPVVPARLGTMNCVVCVEGCDAIEQGQPMSPASSCAGSCDPNNFSGVHCGCAAGPCVAKEVSCVSASTCSNLAPGVCPTEGVWTCAGDCSPGPAAGCSYGQFLAAHGETDMRGIACLRPSSYLFQRTIPAGVVCDQGFLTCQ